MKQYISKYGGKKQEDESDPHHLMPCLKFDDGSLGISKFMNHGDSILPISQMNPKSFHTNIKEYNKLYITQVNKIASSQQTKITTTSWWSSNPFEKKHVNGIGSFPKGA